MVDEVAIIGVSIIGACGLILCLAFAGVIIIRAFRGGGSSRGGSVMDADESRIMQELHAGLMRMESRVESLETILMDRIEKNAPAETQKDHR